MYEGVDFLLYGYGIMNINGFYGHGWQTFGFQSIVLYNPKIDELYVIGANDASFDVLSLFLRLVGEANY